MDYVTTQCPYCGEEMTIEIEGDTAGSMVQDCDVCCNPLQLRVTRNEDGEVEISVDRAQ